MGFNSYLKTFILKCLKIWVSGRFGFGNGRFSPINFLLLSSTPQKLKTVSTKHRWENYTFCKATFSVAFFLPPTQKRREKYEILRAVFLGKKKWGTTHTASTPYPCSVSGLGEFRRILSCSPHGGKSRTIIHSDKVIFRLKESSFVRRTCPPPASLYISKVTSPAHQISVYDKRTR